MAKISPLVLAPPLIFATLALTFFIGLGRDDPNALPLAIAGEVVPPIALDQLGDYPIFDAETLKQPGVKLVNYWASWCAPCRAEHANLVKLKEDGIPIFGVNYKDDPDNAIAFLEELGNPFERIGADTSGRAALNWGLYGVPETYVIDGNGVIILRFAGPITNSILKSTIRPAIARASN